MNDKEIAIVNQVYRESRLGLNAIHNVIGKVYDEELALDLNKQAAKYSRMGEKASEILVENGEFPKPLGILEKARIWTNMQANTVLNTSTGHIAEMMIKENASGMTEVLRSMKQSKNSSLEGTEMANELMDLEEKNINVLKNYVKKR